MTLRGFLITAIILTLSMDLSSADLKDILLKADQGDPDAQLEIAEAYWHGRFGLKKSPEKAFQWYLKSAQQDNKEAQYNLAGMLYMGIGSKKSIPESTRWCLRAAMNGHPKSQYILAGRYWSGEGVVKDELESLAWYYVAQANGETSFERTSHFEELYGPLFARAAQKRAKELMMEISQSKNVDNHRSDLDREKNSSKIKSIGTGVFVSNDGLVLTAAHVVTPASRIQVTTKSGAYPAQKVSIDESNDLALLKIDYVSEAIPLRLTSSVKLGEKVFTLGFPNPQLQGWNIKMTEGSVSSSTGIKDDPRHLQISVPVHPGNSGGPLLDEAGNLVGIVVSKLNPLKTAEMTGDLPQNVNYAVKGMYAMPMLAPYENKIQKENPGKNVDKFDQIIEKSQRSVVLIKVY